MATGLTMEFEFGTNWSMYSHFVGDVFGTPLAIEGLMAFFMESTFVGLMFFGWDRLSKEAHLAVTYLVALGSNLSALWILIANAFMQDPLGATFDPETMRMQFDSFGALVFSEKAQAEFVHTSIAGFVSGGDVRDGHQRVLPADQAPSRVRAALVPHGGLVRVISTLAVITLGDARAGSTISCSRPSSRRWKGYWTTTKPPAEPWKLIAFPDQNAKENDLFDFSIGIPYVLTPLVTHTIDDADPRHRRAQMEAQAKVKHERHQGGAWRCSSTPTTRSPDALSRPSSSMSPIWATAFSPSATRRTRIWPRSRRSFCRRCW